jgi:hypothetical protein
LGEFDTAIAAFVKTVPVSGRSYIETARTDLAINNPHAYRGAVVKAIADEAKRYAAMFGNDYGGVHGGDKPGHWIVGAGSMRAV